MTAREIHLTMLGVGFTVVVHDDRMADLVELLWEPFLGRTDGGAPVLVDVRFAGDRWRIECPPHVPAFALDPWVSCVVLRNLLSGTAIEARPDLVRLHASVVEQNGFYMVLSGPSRAGKTTLAVELLLRGWRLVSDDLAPVSPGAGTALPFPKPLQLRDPALWRRFGGWDVPAWLPAPSVSALIPPGAVALSPQKSYTPNAVIFSRWDPDSAGALEPVTPAEAAALCVQNLQGEPDPTGVLGALGRVCGRARSARMVYPSSETAFGLLGSFLHELADVE